MTLNENELEALKEKAIQEAKEVFKLLNLIDDKDLKNTPKNDSTPENLNNIYTIRLSGNTTPLLTL